jgi:hypothetical protein
MFWKGIQSWKRNRAGKWGDKKDKGDQAKPSAANYSTTRPKNVILKKSTEVEETSLAKKLQYQAGSKPKGQSKGKSSSTPSEGRFIDDLGEVDGLDYDVATNIIPCTGGQLVTKIEPSFCAGPLGFISSWIYNNARRSDRCKFHPLFAVPYDISACYIESLVYQKKVGPVILRAIGVSTDRGFSTDQLERARRLAKISQLGACLEKSIGSSDLCGQTSHSYSLPFIVDADIPAVVLPAAAAADGWWDDGAGGANIANLRDIVDLFPIYANAFSAPHQLAKARSTLALSIVPIIIAWITINRLAGEAYQWTMESAALIFYGTIWAQTPILNRKLEMWSFLWQHALPAPLATWLQTNPPGTRFERINAISNALTFNTGNWGCPYLANAFFSCAEAELEHHGFRFRQLSGAETPIGMEPQAAIPYSHILVEFNDAFVINTQMFPIQAIRYTSESKQDKGSYSAAGILGMHVRPRGNVTVLVDGLVAGPVLYRTVAQQALFRLLDRGTYLVLGSQAQTGESQQEEATKLLRNIAWKIAHAANSSVYDRQPGASA